MRLTHLPDHVDIIPIITRLEHNEIIKDIKKHIELEKIGKIYRQFDMRNMSDIKNKKHLVTFNTGKSNYFLYLTKKNNRQCCFTFDKNKKCFWQIKTYFSEDLYKGTLFEIQFFQVETQIDLSTLSFDRYVNLIGTNYNHILILINDVYLYHNHSLMHQQLNDRYNTIVNIFTDNKLLYQPDQLFEFNFKPLFEYSYLESAWYDFAPTINYYSDISGITFCPLDQFQSISFLLDIDKTLKRPLKFVRITETDKPIDFLVKKTDKLDTYNLYILNSDNDLKFIDIALVNDITASKLLNKIFSNKNEQIVTCYYDKNFKKWKPINIALKLTPDVVVAIVEKEQY